jgi:uncharacterized protein (TIGR03437 family)
MSLGLCAVSANAAALVCVPAASTPAVHAEGLSERLGDIVVTCSGGSPGATVSVNLNLYLAVNDTNRVNSNGTPDISLTIDNSGTPEPANASAVLTSPTTVTWNGLSFTLSPTGSVVLTISNIRANAAQNTGMFIKGFLAFNGVSSVALTTTQVLLAAPQTALFSSASSPLFCPVNGSPLPASITFANLLATGTVFNTTRVTEGFTDAFAPKSDPANSTSDTGTRLILQFSGFPSVARLFVPTFVAGSTADVPTAAGDLGVAASGGQYTPGKGQFLLALVTGADATGAGGSVTPAPVTTTALDSVTEVVMSGGAGYAVFEAVDGNPYVRESAQIPTWLGAMPFEPDTSLQPSENLFLAPISTVGTASPTAPVPRFKAVAPPNDCGLIGDCKANYFPHLFVDTTPIAVTAPVNQVQTFYPAIRNTGSGAMAWTASAQYATGTGWIRLTGAQGVNNSPLRIDIVPAGLAPGAYQANVVIDAGAAGSESIRVTATVVASQPQPLIRLVTSSAGPFKAGIVPDSLVTLWGSDFSGNSVLVTFDGTPADILYDGPNQINVRVPASITGHLSNLGWRYSVVGVSVDGQKSPGYTAGFFDLAPAIFANGVINQDGTANGPSAPAPTGTVVAVYATGLSTSGTITAKVHDRDILHPDYAGPAPTVPGVQQVNIRIPADLPTMQSYVYVCGTAASSPTQKVCSPAQPIWVVQQQ